MAVPAHKSPRFLILRRDNIGDLVCTTPLIDGLRAAHPNAWIGALVNTYNAEVLAGNPALDAVHAYEKLKHRAGSWLSTVFDTLRLGSRLRSEKLDFVLVPAGTPQALQMAARLKPGRVIAAEPLWQADPRHEVLRAFALGASLGLDGAPGPMRMFVDPIRQAQLRRRIGPGPVVAVHISARQAIRRWPIERYAELMRHIGKEKKVMLLWAPGPASDPRHPGDDDVVGQLPPLENVARIETPDLSTLVAALSLADLVICPDGGAMHIAAALGKPVVALWADSPVERWRPWGVPHEVVRPDSRNLADLPLDLVLDAYARLAQERGNQNPGEQR